jgi:hypothetical protein
LAVAVVAITSPAILANVGHDECKEGKGAAVKIDQLPTAAKDIILKEVGTNKITEVREFDRGASKVFLAHWMVDGMTHRLFVLDDGKVLRKVNETKIDLVPMAVKDTALKEIGSNKIECVSLVTLPEGKTRFAFRYGVDGHKARLSLDSNGTLLFKGVVTGVGALPTAVKDTIVKAAADKVTVKSAVAITHGTENFYLAWWKVDGKSFKVKVHPDGMLAETYREISIGEVPALAKDALLKEAGNLKIERVSEITKGDTKEYQASWYVEGRRMAYDVTPEGKALGPLHEMDFLFGTYHREVG